MVIPWRHEEMRVLDCSWNINYYCDLLEEKEMILRIICILFGHQWPYTKTHGIRTVFKKSRNPGNGYKQYGIVGECMRCRDHLFSLEEES